MQELRLVAVSEDGTYAVLAVPGRGGRFSLPIDDRLRTVARGQFSRLAQYEIEVENPLRPKEIQDRIRAGETADEIADVAGIPIDRVRRFEGPVLAEREYRAQEAQRSTVRGHTESGPGPRLGEIVLERLADAGAPADALAWDSRKRTDGNWQVQLQFTVEGRPQIAEWVFDPRRRHVIPADDLARRLCLPQVDWPAGRLSSLDAAKATVTPIGSRLGAHHADTRAEHERAVARGGHAAPVVPAPVTPAPVTPAPVTPAPVAPAPVVPAAAAHGYQSELPRPRDGSPAREGVRARDAGQSRDPGTESGRGRESAQAGTAQAGTAQAGTAQAGTAQAGTAQRDEVPAAPAGSPADGVATAPGRPAADAAPDSEPSAAPQPAAPGRKAAPRGRRSSVPSWDEIMLGNSRQPD